LDDARHDEAADHFSTAVNAGALSSTFIRQIQIYADLTVVRQDNAHMTLSITEYFG
jgi:hypothetical protein